MTSRAREAYLFISLLQAKTGASVIRRLGETPPESVLDTPADELARHANLTDRTRAALEELRGEFDPDSLLYRIEKTGAKAITYNDEVYPERLRETHDPPPALFTRGAIPEGPAVALVGSRKASATGLDAARNLGRSLGERGVCVVSGLALGVDAAAHEGALEAGGPTIGVLGCGIDVVYPKRSHALFEKVRQSGAILSEYAPGEAPLAWRFPARNRVIAGLCEAVVVVEAPEKSGALITARHATDSGREVWAVPGPLGVAECRGSNRLLSDGAGVLWDVPEFVNATFPESADAPVETSPALDTEIPSELPEDEARTVAGVGFEATEVDEVSGRTGLGVTELLPALAMLELKGYVTRDANGAYVRRASR